MKESRVLQLVWQLTLLLCLAEVGYGVFAGSLGLVSDGVHTAANCLGVGTSLFAVRWSKSFASKAYSYDLGMRAEVLAAFTSRYHDRYVESPGPKRHTNICIGIKPDSVILLLLSAFLAFEAIHQLVEDAHHSDHAEHVAYVAFAGVVVNFVGLRLLSPLIGGWTVMWKRLNTQQEESTGPRLLNLEAVALHIVFDILSSLGVIASTMLAGIGFTAADPIVAALIAALTVRGATPMFRRTSRMLAQASSMGFRPEPLLRELAAVDGVLEFYQVHFWSLAPSRDVGSLIIRVRADADDDLILKAAHRIFAPAIWSLTVQIEREKYISSLPSMKNTVYSNATTTPTLAPVRKEFEVVGLKEAAHIL